MAAALQSPLLEESLALSVSSAMDKTALVAAMLLQLTASTTVALPTQMVADAS